MLANDHLAAARARRIMTEADEIALRTARRDRQGVPVHVYDGDDPFQIFQTPQTDGIGPERMPVAWGLVFVWIGVLALVGLGFVLGLLIGTLDSQALLDVLSPTAAQARDAGWVTLSEGL